MFSLWEYFLDWSQSTVLTLFYLIPMTKGIKIRRIYLGYFLIDVKPILGQTQSQLSPQTPIEIDLPLNTIPKVRITIKIIKLIFENWKYYFNCMSNQVFLVLVKLFSRILFLFLCSLSWDSNVLPLIIERLLNSSQNLYLKLGQPVDCCNVNFHSRIHCYFSQQFI